MRDDEKSLLDESQPREDKIALTYGHFSTIYTGHIRYLKKAKEKAGRVITALIGDKGDSKYPFNQAERAEALETVGLVDEVIRLEGNELDVIVKRIKPDIVLLGKEYQGREWSRRIIEIQGEHGGEVEFAAGTVINETSELLKNSETELKKQKIVKLRKILEAEKISEVDLLGSIEKFKETKILVIGDTILDQYAACEAIGLSAEAPVVVVKELEKENFVGGAAIVAAHVAALSAKCTYLSVVGDDEEGAIVKEKLDQVCVDSELIKDEARPTTFKKRYMVGNQKLFRVSKMEESMIPKKVEEERIDLITKLIPEHDGIIVSDFVYGTITKNVLDAIVASAEKYKKKLYGDVQCSSQVGSILDFKGFDVLCPNEREARIALKDRESGIEQISLRIMKETQASNIYMKLGPEGFIIYDKKDANTIKSQQYPALCVNPVDVAGAGDSMLALIATSKSRNERTEEVAALGCIMASMAVENMGNVPIQKRLLIDRVKQIMSRTDV